MFLFWNQSPISTPLVWTYYSHGFKDMISSVSFDYIHILSSCREPSAVPSPFNKLLVLRALYVLFLIAYSIFLLFASAVLLIGLYLVEMMLGLSVQLVWDLVLFLLNSARVLLYQIPIYHIIYPYIITRILQLNLTSYNRLPSRADTSTSYIRLVRIKRGDLKHVINCELVTVSLATAEFDALSYVWGRTLLPYKIKVDGNDFFVTYNLFSALRGLRWPDRDRLVWIDAICINQFDDAEKSYQVRLMKTIYSNASNVIVWLGIGSKATAGAFDFVRQFSDTRTEEECNEWRKMVVFYKRMADIKKELAKILSHEWWSRSWIVQEVVVARHVLIQRGPEQLDWDTLQSIFQYKRFRKTFGLHPTISFAEEVQRLRNELLENDPVPIAFLDLVYRFRGQHATRGSDKIYAILGLLPPGRSTTICPDYSKSYEKVFVDFTLASLAEDKTFSVVTLAPEAALHGISWCRDWRDWRILPERIDDPPYKCFSVHETPSTRNYCTTGGSEPCFKLGQSQRVLKVKGFDLDLVAKTGECLRGHPLNDHGVHLAKWELIAGGPWSSSSNECLASYDSFDRTIVADKWAKGITGWKTNSETLARVPSDEEGSYVKALIWACANRRFFVTQKGRFGLGPLNLKVGDALVAVLGSTVPVVLRRNGKASTNVVGEESEEEYWKVIGEAYCDGLMYYEGDIAKDIDDDKVKLRSYNLR